MFPTSTTLEKPSRNYQVKFHSPSQMKSNTLLMRFSNFLLKDRQWRSYPEAAAQSMSWDFHPGLRLQRLRHITIHRRDFYNQVITHLCYPCKQRLLGVLEQKMDGGRNYKEAWICKREQVWGGTIYIPSCAFRLVLHFILWVFYGKKKPFCESSGNGNCPATCGTIQ